MSIAHLTTNRFRAFKMYFIFSYIDVFCVYFVGSQHQNSQIFEYLLKIIWHQRMFFSPNTQIIGGNRLIGHGVSSMKKLQLLEIVANQKIFKGFSKHWWIVGQWRSSWWKSKCDKTLPLKDVPIKIFLTLLETLLDWSPENAQCYKTSMLQIYNCSISQLLKYWKAANWRPGRVWVNLSWDWDRDVLWLWRLQSHKQGRLQPRFLQMLQGLNICTTTCVIILVKTPFADTF